MKLIKFSSSICNYLSSVYSYGDKLKCIDIDTIQNKSLLSAKFYYLDYKLNIGDIDTVE